jgi:hypothetical protein
MASDFIDDVANYLEAKLDLFTSVSVDVLPDDPNALTIRRTPSAPGSRYLDGSKEWAIGFQILVRHKDQWRAIQEINEITVHLDELGPDALIVAADLSYRFVKCEVTTMPVLVEKDSKKNYLYSALFQATIQKK